MKINLPSKPSVFYADVKEGQTFMFSDTIWMKTTDKDKAVNLEDGRFGLFEGAAMVEMASFELKAVEIEN